MRRNIDNCASGLKSAITVDVRDISSYNGDNILPIFLLVKRIGRNDYIEASGEKSDPCHSLRRPRFFL